MPKFLLKTRTPISVAGNGRTATGKFAPGNKAGKGNPNNARAQRIRNALLKATSRDDVKAICAALVRGAKAGDLAFIREWLDRTAGKPIAADILSRLESLENRMKNPNE